MPLDIASYRPFRPRLNHQDRGFRLSADMVAFAYTMEQRTGKTFLTLDVAAYSYLLQIINLIFVIAPNGVHRDWVGDRDAPEAIREGAAKYLDPALNWRAFAWGDLNPGTKKMDALFNELIEHPGLLLFTINAEAIIWDSALKYLRVLLQRRKSLTVFDESSLFKTPGAARTEKAMGAAQRSVMRRILDGTPDAESPLELFAQYALLDKKILGYNDYHAFRHRYAEFEKISVPTGKEDKDGKPIRRNVEKVKSFQRIDELQKKIAPYTFRVLRADVSDAPAKMYGKRFYDPSSLQIEIYEQLRENFRAEVRAGLEITGTNVMTRYVRYQQVLSNFVPSPKFILCPDCGGDGCLKCEDMGVISPNEPPKVLDQKHHPRLDALAAEIAGDRISLPTVTWACFDFEIDEILALYKKMGRRPVRYDGKAASQEKEDAKRLFRTNEATDFVGKATSGGRGVTLPNAEKIVYYNNFFALRLRLQSEDRAENILKTTSTGVVDVMATAWSEDPTIDNIKVTALRSKQSLSAMINKDPQRKWL